MFSFFSDFLQTLLSFVKFPRTGSSTPEPPSEKNNLVFLMLASASSTAISSFMSGLVLPSNSSQDWNSEDDQAENIPIRILRSKSTTVFGQPVILIVPRPFGDGKERTAHEYATAGKVAKWLSKKNLLKRYHGIDRILLFPGNTTQISIKFPLNVVSSLFTNLLQTDPEKIERKVFVILDDGQPEDAVSMPDDWKKLAEECKDAGLSLKDGTGEAVVDVLKTIIASEPSSAPSATST